MSKPVLLCHSLLEPYQLETKSQLFEADSYLAHAFKGDTNEDDRRLFAQRIPSFGVIHFLNLPAYGIKTFTPNEHGITSDIMLRSITVYSSTTAHQEITFSIRDAENFEIMMLRLVDERMPFAFPDGQIINPDMKIQVRPKYQARRVVVAWQPVHVLDYVEA